MNKKIKVLIADDNVQFCEFVKKYLEKVEYINIIGVVHNNEDEITSIENNKPDLVITDLKRKDSNTIEIIEKYNNLKFLIITGSFLEAYKIKTENIIGIINKPFSDYSIILERINEAFYFLNL